MSSHEVSAAQKKRLPLAKLAVAGGVLVAIAAVAVYFVGWRTLVDETLRIKTELMTLIREAGPLVFFSAMTVLPAVGAPMLAFTVPAGEAFGAQLGLGTVIGIALVAIAINLALGYWLARYVFRPLLLRVLGRYSYQIPKVTPKNTVNVILLVRFTGVPYALQAWLLGCAEVPFRIYMIVSWLSVMPYALAGIILGEGLFKGNFKAIMIGIGLLIAAGFAVHFLRKRFSRRAS